MTATGLPSTSATRIRSLNTIGLSLTPTSLISGGVSGMKPQLSDQASFRISRMIAASSSNFDLSTSRTTMRGFFSPLSMIRFTSGGNSRVMSRS